MRKINTMVLISAVWCIAAISGTASAEGLPGDRIIRSRLADEWLTIESRDFARLSRDRGRDEFRARRVAKAIESEIAGAVRWSQGGQSPKDRATMRKVLLSVQQSPNLARILQTPVGELPASHFHRSSTDLDSLGPRGELPPPPPALDVSDDDESEWAERYRLFDSSWNDVIEVVRAKVQPGSKQLIVLRNQHDRMRQAANSRLASASKLPSSAGLDHLALLQRLVLMAEMPAKSSPLARSVQTPAFSGGTVADLLSYVFKNKLSLEYGSTAQLAVAEAVCELTSSMEYELAQCEDRVERYKAQNSAHNSVLRARLLGVDFIPGTHGGLNSPAYGRPLPNGRPPVVANGEAAQNWMGHDDDVTVNDQR